MKTLEERLREKVLPSGARVLSGDTILVKDALAIVADAQKELTLVGGSISSAPGTISFGSENLRHHRGIDAGETKVPVRDQVLVWLGYWRDHIPPKAVSALQDICGVPTNSPSEGKE